jgi:DUF4097 and DUF4098 domain-containing protein YvlB
MKRNAIGMLVLTSLLAAGFPAAVQAWEINESFAVSAGGNLHLVTERGSIEVDSHKSEKVVVEIEIDGFKENEVDVSFDQSGDTLRINADFQNRRVRHSRVRFTITVPERYNLEVETAGGSISVEDVQGEVNVETSGGSLHLARLQGQVEGYTSGGSIEVETVDGDVDVRTSGGSIYIEDVSKNVLADTSGGSVRITGVAGDVEAETSGGSMKFKAIAGRLEGHTSGGSISAEFPDQPGGDVVLSTSGGSVSVELEETAAISLRARGGWVKSDFPVDGVKSAKRRLRGDINGGGPVLELESSSGNVYIEKG